MPIDLSRFSAPAGLAAAAIALSTACASANKPSASPPPLPDGSSTRRETIILSGNTPYQYRPRSDSYVAAVVDAPTDPTWKALPAAFEELGLSIDGVDTDAKRLSSAPVRLRGHMGKVPLDTYLDCGRGPLGSEAALTYDVSLQVTSEVDRVSDTRSEVRSYIAASAKPNATSGDAVSCETRGKLERRIAEAAQRHLPKP